MNFSNFQSYTYSQIKGKVQEYEEETKFLLTERKVNSLKKTVFKMICVKGPTNMCPFKITFNKKDNDSFVFQGKSSCLKHNHKKMSQTFFQKQFFKRDFIHLEQPLSEILLSNPKKNIEEDINHIKPKKLLKILKENGSFTPNITKGFKAFPKIFKKKFDNLLRKVKLNMRKKDGNSEESTIFSEDMLLTPHTQKIETNFLEEKSEEKLKDFGSGEFINESKDFPWESFINEEDPIKWFQPFNFY